MRFRSKIMRGFVFSPGGHDMENVQTCTTTSEIAPGLQMGLDLVVEGCAKLGCESEWLHLLERSFAGNELSEVDAVRFQEISIPGYQRIDRRLIEVMSEWRFPTVDLAIVHVSNRQISRPVRLFKEFAVQMAPALFPNLPI
jgi:hypothetical protein